MRERRPIVRFPDLAAPIKQEPNNSTDAASALPTYVHSRQQWHNDSHHLITFRTPTMPPRINLPPLTRTLLLTLLALSALNVSLRFRKWSNATSDPSNSLTAPSNYISAPQLAIPYLVLVPTRSLLFPWTFVTAALVENNIVSLAVSGVVIWFGGRYLERAWGSKGLGWFLGVATVVPNVMAFFIYALWHALTGTPEYPTPIQGLLAVESALLVALKQLVPEHTVSLFRGVISMRVKHFPSIFILANMLSGPLLGTDTAFWLSLTGFVVSWVYLRFYKRTEVMGGSGEGEGSTMRGDASDTFAFVAFFPDALHPIISPISDGIYSILVQLKLCTPFSEEAIETSNQSRSDGLPNIMNARPGAAGGRRAEAERRRALALKALDQRLNAAAATRAAPASAAGAAPNISGDTPETAAGAVENTEPVKEAQA